MMKRLSGLLPLLLLLLSGCSSLRFSYTNTELVTPPPPAPTHASFAIADQRGAKDVLVLMALSGGGSRAAYLSSSVMLKMQQFFPDLDLLKQVDVISSVSGGSLVAAYYCISYDPDGLTLNVEGRLDCEPVRQAKETERIVCDPLKNQIGFQWPGTPAGRDALLRAYPSYEQGIQRLYELSQKKVRSNRPWSGPVVRDLMTRNYVKRWIGNWFWPTSIFRYWTTAYDRSDIMAQTFEDNLFDVYPTGQELTFADINPERPYLIINATDLTEDHDRELRFGEAFTFTDEDFGRIRSNIRSYSVARGVMASAAFPAVFSTMTLRDYRTPSPADGSITYVHVFDGGNRDNLGLTSLRRIIDAGKGRYRHTIVVLVDAFVEPKGLDRHDGDPRRSLSYFVDMNFMDSFDTLLNANRDQLLEAYRFADPRTLTFLHLTFDDIKEGTPDQQGGDLRTKVRGIATDFRISEDDAKRIDLAVDALFEVNRPCLSSIRDIVLGGTGAKGCANSEEE